MGKPDGFLEYPKQLAPRRPVEERLRDWKEIALPLSPDQLRVQGARCMDCGIPFCHEGCPLGNQIPDWNDLVYRDQWRKALERLHRTNNFPEFTGRLCPAPCESACVLSIHKDAVTIKQIELAIVERGFEEGGIPPRPPASRTGKRVAVVGSGPAGLAAAQQLNYAGHQVIVFERDGRPGGLLRYGIPEFKMEKKVLDRRLQQMEEEGVRFRTGCAVGSDISAIELQRTFDAMVLAGGARRPRDLPVPGRELRGVHFAMEYLTLQNRICEGSETQMEGSLSARDKHVVIIGGGDTGADCLGTAHRQGARSVLQLELLPRPPESRDPLSSPWPLYPNIFRVSAAHEEGGDRLYSVSTRRFSGRRGRVEKLHAVNVEPQRDARGKLQFEEIPGSEVEIPADLVLLAMGFVGAETNGMLQELGVAVTERGNVARDDHWMTSVTGVFTAGDMQRGQSLIVWALADGRSCARAVDEFLMGESHLHAPLP